MEHQEGGMLNRMLRLGRIFGLQREGSVGDSVKTRQKVVNEGVFGMLEVADRT
jgi:hypothetical protein